MKIVDVSINILLFIFFTIFQEEAIGNWIAFFHHIPIEIPIII